MRKWVQNAWRLITEPYAFFEEMIGRDNPIWATAVFLAFLSLESIGWRLAGWNYSVWAGGFLTPLITYPAAIITIYLVCHLLVRENRLASFFSVWGFSYLPTFLFFSLNILFHWLLRFHIFSAIPNPLLLIGLWAFIFLMFLWKLLFLTITLRLAGNLNLKQIIPALVILGTITVIYWWVGLYLGLLKIPYI